MRPWSFLSMWSHVGSPFDFFVKLNCKELANSFLKLYVTGLKVVSNPGLFHQGSSDLTKVAKWKRQQILIRRDSTRKISLKSKRHANFANNQSQQRLTQLLPSLSFCAIQTKRHLVSSKGVVGSIPTTFIISILILCWCQIFLCYKQSCIYLLNCNSQLRKKNLSQE